MLPHSATDIIRHASVQNSSSTICKNIRVTAFINHGVNISFIKILVDIIDVTKDDRLAW